MPVRVRKETLEIPHITEDTEISATSDLSDKSFFEKVSAFIY